MTGREDDFSESTKETLAKRVNYLCSMRGCRIRTSGPRTSPEKTVSIGMAAHITAASIGGPRYDASLTSEQRRSPENGIWMCYNHGKLVDNDEKRYATADLQAMKAEAEKETIEALEIGRSVRFVDSDEGLAPRISVPDSPSEFAIRVRFDRERAMRMISDPNTDPKRPRIYAVANSLMLTNISAEPVAAFLELVVPQAGGRDEIIGAEVADVPRGFVLDDERLGNTQFRRLVNIPARAAVIGFVGFNLTERFIGPETLRIPEMWRDPSNLHKLAEGVPVDKVEELLDGFLFVGGILLRVTNALDRSCRDFPPMGGSTRHWRKDEILKKVVPLAGIQKPSDSDS